MLTYLCDKTKRLLKFLCLLCGEIHYITIKPTVWVTSVILNNGHGFCSGVKTQNRKLSINCVQSLERSGNRSENHTLVDECL